MSKKPLIVAIALIGIGIVFGVALVTGFSGSSVSKLFAGGVDNLGAKSAPVVVGENVKALNDAFISASKAVEPTVVFIKVKGERKAAAGGDIRQFFKFFGPRGEEGMGEDDMPSERAEGSGSGVIISGDGFIVTNNHVVEDASADGISVTTYDKKEYKAKLIGKDKTTDLAVIKIEAGSLPVAYLGSPNDIKLGEWVLAVGNPLGLRSTITTGIISALGRGGLGLNNQDYGVENYIQTDAAINPGNSGGGLFSLNGSLIGINTAIASRTGYYSGYGFAIPIDIVRTVVLDLINNGKVNRAYLGVKIQSVDPKTAKGYGLKDVAGVLVQEVLKGSPAENAGLDVGDIILEFDGEKVTSQNQLTALVLLKKPGDNIKVKLFRDGNSIVKNVVLKARDESDMASNDEPASKGESTRESEGSNEPVTLKSLGFTVGPLTEKVKNETEVKSGVLVTKVDGYSEASERGLQSQNVIIEADRQSVSSPQQLKKIIEKKKAGDVVLLKVKVKDQKRIVSLEIPEQKN